MQFIADLEPNEDGALQIMYGIDGRRDLTESTRDDLSGYAGARPVRIGNGAFDQRQNDVFGAALDSILLHTRRSKRLPRRLWPIVQAQAECATAVWREPDQGIWEARGEPQHYVSSKLMGWVALDRAAKLADIARRAGAQRRPGRATAEEIKADILEHGVDGRGVLRQHYATDALDASTLLAALFGFLPADDERLRASVAGHRRRAHRARLRPALPHRRDRRRPVGQGGHVPHLLVLARVRRWPSSASASARATSWSACSRVASPLGPVRRGVRRRHRPPPGQLPAGLLAPRADRGRRRGSSSPSGWRSSADERLRRDRDRNRCRRWDARAAPRPLREAHPPARARRLAPARAAELARARRLRRQPLRLARTRGTTATASPSSRRCTTASAAPRSSTAPRCTACARRTSASCATTTASRRRGPSATTRWSRTTRGPSSSTTCTARAARTRPSRPPARRTRSRP